jgi:Tol biopolymer transport system component
MRRAGRGQRGVAILLAVAAAGCGRFGFARVGVDDAASDGALDDAIDDASDGKPDAACTWTAFSMPAPLPGPIQSTTDDWSPAPTLGELQVFFHSYRSSSLGRIWMAARASRADPYGAATMVSELVNSTSQQFAPTLTGDGLRIIYADNAPGNFNLYEAVRTSPTGPFQAPQLIAGVNFAPTTQENFPFVSADGLRLVWSSNRNGANSTIYEATRPDLSSGFGTPSRRAELEVAGSNLASPTLSHDGLDIYFSSDRPGGSGGYDIYTARRPALDQPFGPVTRVVELSSARDDGGVDLTPDGATMYLNYDAMFAGGGNAELSTATRVCN